MSVEKTIDHPGTPVNIDEQLELSAPRLAPRSPELLKDLAELSLEAERKAARRKPRLRWRTAGLLAAAAIGIGTAANAAGVIHLAFAWTSQRGNTCKITPMKVHLAPPSTDNVPQAQRERTLTEARRYLEHYDFGSIDVPAVTAEFERRVRHTHYFKGPDSLEVGAVLDHVTNQLRAHLRSLGLDPDVLEISSTINIGIDPTTGRGSCR